jgi:hypothetical protein
MTSGTKPATSWLDQFGKRLRGGVNDSLASTRPEDHERRDQRHLQQWPETCFGLMNEIRAVPWTLAGEPGTTISQLTAMLREHPGLLTAVIFAPHLLLDRLRALHGGEPADEPADCLLVMCWAAEAAWSALTGPARRGTRLADADAVLLRPVAARMRFLVLSEPLRWRAQPDPPWTDDIADRAFGQETWADLVTTCREARREWQDCLDAYQSHPLLRNADPPGLEQEIRLLVFTSAGRHGVPLRLSARHMPSQRGTLTPDDVTVITDTVEQHLLPRFAIAAVARLMVHDDSRLRQRLRRLLAATVVACGLGAVGCAAGLQVHWAVQLVAACYLLICLGVVLLPAGWGTMWLLRMPGAAAVGMGALISFLPAGWLLRPPPGGRAAAVALVSVASGYLLIEVRNHGAAPLAAIARALLVTALGAAHAVMVSVIGLVVIAPAFVSDGAALNQLWSHPAYGHAGVVLALAAAWCLAIGVFSQILWDDRPITAPLAHLSWRG